MAQINIVQPLYGRLVVLSSSETEYIVRYDPPAETIVRGDIKLFCEACGQTLIRSAANPATFDIRHLEDSGHPGPFDISVDVKLAHRVSIRTYASPPEGGTTSPAISEDKIVADGGTATFTISATPTEGWTFEYWLTPNGTKIYQRAVNLNITNVTRDIIAAMYTAYFSRTVPVYDVHVGCIVESGDADYSARLAIANANEVQMESQFIAARGSLTGESISWIGGEAIVRKRNGETLNLTFVPGQRYDEVGMTAFGWRVVDRETDEVISVTEGFSVSLTVDREVSVYLVFRVADEVALKVSVDRALYGYLEHIDGYLVESAAAVMPNGAAPIASSLYRSMTVRVKSGAAVRFGLWRWRERSSDWAWVVMTPAAENAVVHGASAAMTLSGNTATVTASSAGGSVVVYLCSHMLSCVGEDEFKPLESAPAQLVYDCQNPG